jgi:hypothetical protein
MGDDVKNKILERCGIKIADSKQPQSISKICWRCNYVNRSESKYCERSGCNSPLTQLALDEIKASEKAKLQLLVNESNLERDNTIQALQQELKSYDEQMKEVTEKMKDYVKWQKKDEEMRRVMYDTLDRLSPGWKEPFLTTLRRPLTPEARKKVEEFQEKMKALPDDDNDDSD